ncbi:MAG TPA: 3'-5' exonuclease [Acidimicrobiia bacterium]
MTLAISLDIETLSTHKNAVVLSIGACTVSLNGERRQDFHCRLDAQSQIDAGRHVSASTLAWWMNQNPVAKLAAFEGEGLPVDHALTALRTWITHQGNPPVWTKGPAFDGAILESLAEDWGLKPCWPYRDHRDLRTIEEAARLAKDETVYERWHQVMERATGDTIAHHALGDAIAQGAVVQWWLEELVNG